MLPMLMLPGLLVGCTEPLNDRPTLGGSYIPPTFRTSSTTPTVLEHPSQHLLSTTPKPRAAWTPTQYLAPMDGVVHSPILMVLAPIKHTDPPRVFGRYPTPTDALKLSATTWIEDLFITIDDYGRSFIGTPYAIGYFTFTGKLAEPLLSPQSWKRTETANTWSSGYPASNDPNGEPTDE